MACLSLSKPGEVEPVMESVINWPASKHRAKCASGFWFRNHTRLLHESQRWRKKKTHFYDSLELKVNLWLNLCSDYVPGWLSHTRGSERPASSASGLCALSNQEVRKCPRGAKSLWTHLQWCTVLAGDSSDFSQQPDTLGECVSLREQTSRWNSTMCFCV